MEEQGMPDDVITEILLRLPSKSVLRCGAVCRSWRCITTCPYFLATHSSRRPNEMVVVIESDKLGTVPLTAPVKGRQMWESEGRPWSSRPLYFCCPKYKAGDGNTIAYCKILDSLDGLLVFEQRVGLYFISNPTTRQRAYLPPLGPETCTNPVACGFYFHRPSGEYRLLCHGTDQAAATGGDLYYTLSAGGSQPRRLVAAPAERPRVYQPPVTHRGALHWLPCFIEVMRTGKMRILAFDTASETFRLMSTPPVRDGDAMSLVELGGVLCVAAMKLHDGTSLDIWALQQDCEAETERSSWVLRYHVEMPLIELGLNVVVRSVVAAGEDVILVGRRHNGVARWFHLKEGRLLKQLHLWPRLVFLVFRESLVRHAFFDSPGPDLSHVQQQEADYLHFKY
uniref:F-box domain-containing protein n=1 Tax=Oryza punctata TaxID=4537 RepID=A0A0E0L5X6_ORYPU